MEHDGLFVASSGVINVLKGGGKFGMRGGERGVRGEGEEGVREGVREGR